MRWRKSSRLLPLPSIRFADYLIVSIFTRPSRYERDDHNSASGGRLESPVFYASCKISRFEEICSGRKEGVLCSVFLCL